MSRFKRKEAATAIKKNPRRPSDRDALRPDKKTIPPPTDKEIFQANCNMARKMKEIYGWQSWMGDFIDENENDRPYQKELIT